MTRLNDQYEAELKYSKKMFKQIIMDDILESFPMDMFNTMYDRLEEWTKSMFKAQKRANVKQVAKQLDLAVDMVIMAVAKEKFPVLVQKSGTWIGNQLGLGGLDAIRTGASILGVLEGTVYHLEKSEEGIQVVSHIVLKKRVKRKLKNLQYLPPVKCKPKQWHKNTGGGYYAENQSILLGSGNHHELKQSYDVLNILQDIAWELDTEVAETVRNKNKVQMTVGKKQFKNIIKEYTDTEFYFVHKYDKRGRVYSSGYDLNIQGDEYHKALLNPVHKEELTTSGIQGLKVAVAGYAGKDKLTWQERIDWFESSFTAGHANEEIQWDKPILGEKALRAYRETINTGKTSFMMELDATSSGIQIMSVLSGCKTSARTCNLIDTGKREDVYTSLADKMNQTLTEQDQVTRKMVKKPLMTKTYNSESVPKKAFNVRQLKAFNEALKGMIPGVMDVMSIINQCWQLDQDYHEWTLPDGHVAHVNVMEPCDIKLKIKELDNSQIRYRYYKQQSSENYRSLAPNIIHSIDAYILREMVRRSHEQGIQLACIHDCFMVHPNHWKAICSLYRTILMEIADSDLLSDILSQVTGTEINLEKDSNDLSGDILNSKYALS